MINIDFKQANFHVISKQSYNTGKSLTVKDFDYFMDYQDKLSFKKADEPSKETMKYLESVKNYYQKNSLKIDTLNELDLKKMMDICKGIPVFAGWNAIDLMYATNNIDSIMLSRGCYKQCTHCGADALPKIKFMKWKNFTELVDGIETLKERLGFNPFCNARYNSIYPFHDSDPVDYRQIDDKKQMRTIFDAAKYFYDKTGTKFVITTAGWAPENKVAQEAMKNFLIYPEIVKTIVLSVHPFHSLITKSIELEKQGDYKKAQLYRDRYIDTMANDIKILAPLIKKNKFFINLEFDNSSDYLSLDSAKSLMLEIYQKIKSDDPDFYFIKEDETINTIYKTGIIDIKKILKEGRAIELTHATPKTKKQVTKYNLLLAKKYVDVDGRILASDQNTDLEAKFVALPKKLHFSEDTKFHEEYSYPSLQESDLTYKPSEWATNISKNIMANFLGKVFNL